MSVKRIIPCLDVCDGRVVKGEHFVGFKDAGDPVEFAKQYTKSSADELVFLDITATTEGRKTTVDLVRRTAQEVTIPFTVGGGIASIEDIRTILEAGATKISINSAAIKHPDLINEAVAAFGGERIVVAIDVVKSDTDERYDVVINGGTLITGKDAVEWAVEVEKRGASEILLTSMDGDGTKNGYDMAITQQIAEAVSIPVIASGGAGKLSDFYDVLTTGKAAAALAASLFHFKTLEVSQVKKYLRKKGVEVNL